MEGRTWRKNMKRTIREEEDRRKDMPGTIRKEERKEEVERNFLEGRM